VSDELTSRYPDQCLADNVRPESGIPPVTDYPSDSDDEEDDSWLATTINHSFDLGLSEGTRSALIDMEHSLNALRVASTIKKKGDDIPPLAGVVPGQILQKDQLIQPDEDGMTPLGDMMSTNTEWKSNEQLLNDDYLNVHIQGTPEEQRRLRELIYRKRQVFQTAIPRQPALVTPLTLEVDHAVWQTASNRRPFRTQSALKDTEIKTQIEVMLESGVIIRSDSQQWSQVLLTPKPNMKWRFCIDYRQLNLALQAKGFPLPRIDEMLTRIGSQQNQHFAKFDLSHGYHQMPLSAGSRRYTAFTSRQGLFEWTRVPMGLKNAPAYFQEVMATEVLSGLVYSILEVYLDDVITYGQDFDTFYTRVEQILERFERHKISVNPNKCFIGLKEIEILGHLINSEGMSFTRDKLAGVNEIKLPKTGAELLSFLGLSNWFRKHVRDYAQMDQPLRQLVQEYPGNRAIQWIDSTTAIFERLKSAVWNCSTLFFVDPNAPVYLHTDACDYGIGGYLYQVIEGEERPIGFMSKALHGAELNWSTIEKEAYAIWKSLKTFEYLLRDITFRIRTDHRNLLYLNEAGSRKVLAWKLDIQQFNFDVEHIPGRNNEIADAFSRLCTLMTRGDESQQGLDDLLKEWEESTELAIGKLNIPYTLAAQTATCLPNTRQPAPQPATFPSTIPLSTEEYELIGAVHNSICGHHGVERTLRLLRERSPKTWPSMRKAVKQFIRQCPQCQMMADSKLSVHIAPFNVSRYYPMDRLNIDSIGPLPPDEHGNEYILVIIDVFSRFVELYPLPDLTAKSTAPAIIQHIGRYGQPDEILTDNGSQFRNELMTELMRLMDIEHVTIMAYSHEENSIVERANKEVMRHLRAIIFDRRVKASWSIYLPIVQRIMNASIVKSIGVAPASIIFGNNIDLDRGILKPHKHLPESTMHQYLEQMMQAQSAIIAIAQETQRVINNEHVSNAQRQTAAITQFPINSYVKVRHHETTLKMVRPTKVSANYKGPYRVINQLGSRYTLQNLVTMKEEIYLAANLQPFLFDPNVVDPRIVARDSVDEFDIHSILDIRGNKHRGKWVRTNLEFLVKWDGYDDPIYNTWEPYSGVRDTEQLHQYLHAHNLQYLIPNKFR